MDGVAVDQRRSEWRVRMSPAREQRKADSIAPRLKPAWKQPDQPARLERVHQHGTGIRPQHRRGREREGGLIKDVRLCGAARQRAPLGRNAGKPGERTPFGGESGFERSQHVATNSKRALRFGWAWAGPSW